MKKSHMYVSLIGIIGLVLVFMSMRSESVASAAPGALCPLEVETAAAPDPRVQPPHGGVLHLSDRWSVRTLQAISSAISVP